MKKSPILFERLSEAFVLLGFPSLISNDGWRSKYCVIDSDGFENNGKKIAGDFVLLLWFILIWLFSFYFSTRDWTSIAHFWVIAKKIPDGLLVSCINLVLAPYPIFVFCNGKHPANLNGQITFLKCHSNFPSAIDTGKNSTRALFKHLTMKGIT